ncbi:restriction endonuclease subunit S [Bacillus cereus]|uniref:restriction endonuclease subunit S n=1 Tax=Bacillus cereus TaxID=1396 RepID=UPI003BF8D21E
MLEYVQRTNFYKKYGEMADGGRRAKRIQVDTFLGFPIYTPNLKEQQKIASCLSSLDGLINAEDKKLKALKAHKKGLMQKMFPADGKTVPEWRFPEFRDSGEWEECTFGDMATFFNGRAFKQDELLQSGKYRVLRVGNVFSNNSWYYSNLELDENKYCENGDLLYAWSATFGPKIWHGEKVIYHYHIWKVSRNKDVAQKFLFVLLDRETEKMKSQSANGLGLLHITKGTIENWKCYKPKFEEQEKIADCFSSIDTLITSQAEKIESLKKHKKGLIQGLFPSIEEVSE